MSMTYDSQKIQIETKVKCSIVFQAKSNEDKRRLTGKGRARIRCSNWPT